MKTIIILLSLFAFSCSVKEAEPIHPPDDIDSLYNELDKLEADHQAFIDSTNAITY